MGGAGGCTQDRQCAPGTICIKGSCVPGDCHDNDDCDPGQICGLHQPYHCAGCDNDGQCTTAFGANHICVGGVCIPGNCHGDGDCNGGVCGLTMPHFCGACTSDAQCPPGDICATSGPDAGHCVGAACQPEGRTCTANPSDYCCGSSCVPGNCCTGNDCTAGQVCVHHVCSACPSPSGNFYFVDPVHGSDQTGTGAPGASCAFKTVSHAASLLAAGAPAGTQIVVLGPASLSNQEVYPIVVPAGVLVRSQGGRITASALGPVFQLSNAQSGLAGFTINGLLLGGGIVVRGGSATVSDVTVTATLGDCITASGGSLAIGPNVLVTACLGNGLAVAGSGHAVVQSSRAGGIAFDLNLQSGIDVSGAGTLDLLAEGQMVQTLGNAAAGVRFAQTPGAALATSTIDSLTAGGNNDGLSLHAGSAVEVRRSSVLANKRYGVDILPGGPAAAHTNDASGIDLGRAGSPGGNTFQNLLLGNEAGICNELAGTNAPVAAQGNRFATRDCAAGGGTLRDAASCRGGVDVGVRNAGNAVDVAPCTTP
jgi:hypothetical protein